MPKVPERKPSYGELTSKLTKLHNMSADRKYHEAKLPNALKCSKCTYVATSRTDLDLHWLDEH